jgi:hypothetical protein
VKTSEVVESLAAQFSRLLQIPDDDLIRSEALRALAFGVLEDRSWLAGEIHKANARFFEQIIAALDPGDPRLAGLIYARVHHTEEGKRDIVSELVSKEFEAGAEGRSEG